jgi:octaprenyl-diphosphate synthase
MIEPVEPFLEAVDRGLAQQVKTFDPEVVPYADYALNAQGKHLRPALVALTAEAFGKATDKHVTAAVIIEMVHLATLVHDDVMDEATIRRGKPTVAANWGNDIAVLFGDCLFAQALVLAASFPTPEVCRAVAAATNTVCAGEIVQTRQRADFTVSKPEYFRVLGMKTGELFALSCELSAFLSGVGPELRTAFRQFGMAFGTAYQIYDDCLDLFGSEAAAGKSLGTDVAQGKLTLPLLLLWERSSAAERETVENLVKNWGNGSMKKLSGLLARHGTLAASLEIMGEYLDSARQALLAAPASEGRARLLSLTDYLYRQTDSLRPEPKASV